MTPDRVKEKVVHPAEARFSRKDNPEALSMLMFLRFRVFLARDGLRPAPPGPPPLFQEPTNL